MNKKKYLTVTFFLVTIFSFGQNSNIDTVNVKNYDFYGLKIFVLDSVITSKQNCSGLNPKDLTTLYYISIEKVYFFRDIGPYNDTLELKNVKFILIKSKLQRLKIGEAYYITASYSPIPDYILANKTYFKEVIFNTLYSGLKISLGPCYKLNIFQKILIHFKNKDNFYKKAKPMDKSKNRFYRAIQSYKKK